MSAYYTLSVTSYSSYPQLQSYVIARCSSLRPWLGSDARSVYIYRVSQEEWTRLREGVPYVKVYRYNPKHLYPKLNGYGDNGKRSLKL